jgi:glutamyl-tRNA synthetase
VALTGGTASPGIYDVVQILGREETLRRLDDALREIA